jgi:ribonuclease HII
VVAGVDEAGRGSLAGPVVAAAVILPPDCILPDVKDSKRLTPAARERLCLLIREAAVDVAVAVAAVEAVDALNVLRATHVAMRQALSRLSPTPDLALVDGLPVPELGFPQMAIVKGDCRSVSIAAASIIAKVERDRMMCELEARFPGYGFADHKGYGTQRHIQALRALGPCPAHRRSFAPVRLSAQMDLLAD